MRLRYHLDLLNEGLIVLESEPQMRNIGCYSASKGSIRLPLPYIQFTIRYFKFKDKFHYPGLYGSGLRVTGSLNALSSTDDNAFRLPLGDYHGALVCTPHMHDMQGFDNLFKLVNFVISTWYGLAHSINCRKWANCTLETINELPWVTKYIKYYDIFKPSSLLLDGFETYKDYPEKYGNLSIPSFDIKLPNSITFIDKQWENNLKLKLLST